MKKVQAVARTYLQKKTYSSSREGNLSKYLEDGWLVISSQKLDDDWIEYIVEKEVQDNE